MLAVAGGLLAMSVDAGFNAVLAAVALLAVALAMVRWATWIVSRPPSAEYAEHAGKDVTRRFLLGVSAILLGSVPPAEYFINEIWNTEAVPGSYEFAVTSTQMLLTLVALVLMAVAVRRRTAARSVGTLPGYSPARVQWWWRSPDGWS